MAYNPLPTLGQKTMAASLPVVIASNQDVLATSAKQDTIIGHLDGVEGILTTMDADTGSIMTAVQLIDDAIFTAGTSTYTEATSKGQLILGVRRDADTTLVDTTNEMAPLQLDANGRLKVEIFTGGETFAVLDTNSAAALTALQLIDNAVSGSGFNITQLNGVNVTMGNGAAGTGVQRVTLASDSTGNIATIGTSVTPGTAAANLGKARDSAIGATDTGIAMLGVRRDTPTAETPAAGDYIVPQYSANGEAWVRTQGELADDAAFTVGTTRVQPIGLLADESSTDSVDEGDLGAARMTLDRKQIVVPQPHTAGGLTIFRSLDLDESEEEVKATAGCVYSMWVTNTATSTRFVKFYNLTAANTTVGSSTPVITIGIPGNSSDDVTGLFGGGFGIMFDTAISVAATTGVADADTGAPGANEVIINIFYK